MKFISKFFLFIFIALGIISPSFLVWRVITVPSVKLKGGQKVVRFANKQSVLPDFPNTEWGHLMPCGVLFNEQLEFNKNLSCLNKTIFTDDPLLDITLPRCFVVGVSSPDVFYNENDNLNFILVSYIIGDFSTGQLAVQLKHFVSYYDEIGRTIFIVENPGAEMFYRHVSLYYFLQEKNINLNLVDQVFNSCELQRKLQKPKVVENTE